MRTSPGTSCSRNNTAAAIGADTAVADRKKNEIKNTLEAEATQHMTPTNLVEQEEQRVERHLELGRNPDEGGADVLQLPVPLELYEPATTANTI